MNDFDRFMMIVENLDKLDVAKGFESLHKVQ